MLSQQSGICPPLHAYRLSDDATGLPVACMLLDAHVSPL